MKAIDIAVRLLAESKFAELEHLTHQERLTSEMMRTAISQYGRTVCVPKNYADVDIVPIKDGGRAWSAWVPLHSLEGDRPDLTLLLRLAEKEDGEILIQVDDIRTL